MARDGNLRVLFREYLPDGDWCSVETGGTASGVPDSNYCFPGGFEGWVEGKRTLGWVVGFQPAQVGWIMRRCRRGGRCFVAIHRLNRGDDELYIVRGSDVEEFSRAGSSLRRFRKFLGPWRGGPRCWDWGGVRKIFTS